jgi:putative addiction module component (TIGR02574 family)
VGRTCHHVAVEASRFIPTILETLDRINLDAAGLFLQIQTMANNHDFDFSRLTPAERLQLAQTLWDSVDDAVGLDVLPLTEDERADLDGRLADLAANPEDAVPWEQVKRQILGSLNDEKRHQRGA